MDRHPSQVGSDHLTCCPGGEMVRHGGRKRVQRAWESSGGDLRAAKGPSLRQRGGEKEKEVAVFHRQPASKGVLLAGKALCAQVRGYATGS